MATVLHPAIWVSDLDATISFYTDVLDLRDSRESRDDEERNIFLQDSSGAEVQFKNAPDNDVDAGRDLLDHLAFEVDDIEATVDQARSAESDVITEPYTNDAGTARGAYVTDPDGYAIELIEYL